MRIAAYNVENLFDRARVFNDENGSHQDVLDAHAEINTLFEKPEYTAADKARMLVLLTRLGMLNDNEGPYVRLRRIRGQLIRRPRDRDTPREIVADGREDWIGWVELKTETVDATAMLLTARVIFDVGADILAMIEAESRPVLKTFQEIMARKLDLPETYAHVMLIDGNDRRGIDVGLATRAGYPIGPMLSHADDLTPDGHPIFSRDCPEYEVATPGGETVTVLVNHFKSKFGGNDARSRAKRRAQAQAVAGYYQRLRAAGQDRVVVLGDLNDTPDSAELAPLLETDLRDASAHPAFTQVEFRAYNGQRGIGTFGLGNDDDKIDYLLLSPALFDRMTGGGLYRKGAWPGSRPPRWEVYPELTAPHHAASDHHLIWADIDL
ncbi:Endonuclease/Exonuclease/phosphatase family protein [Sulfitobacter sp. THAF37]|uniref:endonuclease/exonuclease/phosphatase family protein n=1 Tax=Sulfitobacter sp. THAF37 TaxID=2587855 RepID=UPI001267DEA7|nr:endonuclease/exonuclease/phosphatase family protein [Sulfitobacter sp. THAF37]QFT59006.1 Endonuclease/Exonuclease/phosphatase family protein [Sulfitobacter sp. THAF37]